jgi:hypothetical protein
VVDAQAVGEILEQSSHRLGTHRDAQGVELGGFVPVRAPRLGGAAAFSPVPPCPGRAPAAPRSGGRRRGRASSTPGPHTTAAGARRARRKTARWPP